MACTRKKGHNIDICKLCPKGKYCCLSWLDKSLKKYHNEQTKSVLDRTMLSDVFHPMLNLYLFSENFYLHAPRRYKIRSTSLLLYIK